MRRMKATVLSVLAAGLAATMLVGCSASGAASTGFNMFRNTQNNKLDIRVFVDGYEAKRNEMKQAAMGSSKWKVADKVSTSPRIRWEHKDAEGVGRVRSVSAQIFAEFKDGYSSQPEYSITSTSTDAEMQMKPGMEYNLAMMPADYQVTDFSGKKVSGVTLKPGTKYMLTLSIVADDSETAQIYFETR